MCVTFAQTLQHIHVQHFLPFTVPLIFLKAQSEKKKTVVVHWAKIMEEINSFLYLTQKLFFKISEIILDLCWVWNTTRVTGDEVQGKNNIIKRSLLCFKQKIHAKKYCYFKPISKDIFKRLGIKHRELAARNSEVHRTFFLF